MTFCIMMPILRGHHGNKNIHLFLCYLLHWHIIYDFHLYIVSVLYVIIFLECTYWTNSDLLIHLMPVFLLINLFLLTANNALYVCLYRKSEYLSRWFILCLLYIMQYITYTCIFILTTYILVPNMKQIYNCKYSYTQFMIISIRTEIFQMDAILYQEASLYNILS